MTKELEELLRDAKSIQREDYGGGAYNLIQRLIDALEAQLDRSSRRDRNWVKLNQIRQGMKL